MVLNVVRINILEQCHFSCCLILLDSNKEFGEEDMKANRFDDDLEEEKIGEIFFLPKTLPLVPKCFLG